MAIADLAQVVTAHRLKSTRVRKALRLKRVMIQANQAVPLLMAIALMVELIESLTLVIFNTRLGILLEIIKSLGT